jgi:hypothetical protein
MTIGQRLEEFARKQFGGIPSLNKKINEVSGKKTSIYKYIKDDRSPGAILLVPLAKLGCNLNWLLLGTGDMLYDANANRKVEDYRHEKVKLEAQVGVLKQMLGDLISKESTEKKSPYID